MQPHEVPPQSFLNSLVGVGVTLALLYWAKAVLIPVALALLLTFLLTPLVTTLWHWGLSRALAAVVVVGLAAGGGAPGGPAVVTSWTASWSFPSTPPVPACRTWAIFCLRLAV